MFFNQMKDFVLLSIIILLLSCDKNQETCLDGIKNGSETDIDCGGDCPLFCDSSATPLGFYVPCQFTTTDNTIAYDTSVISLPYYSCGPSGQYYSIVRANTSNLLSSNYYILILFNGTMPIQPEIIYSSGTSFPDPNEVQIKINLNGSIYYLYCNLYFDPNQGNYICYICGAYAGSNVHAKIMCI